MSRLAFPAVLFLTALIQAPGAGMAAAIQDPGMVVLPDPDPARAVHFPAGAATAGVAHIGPALDKTDIRTQDCSAGNPCASVTPARSDTAVAIPKMPVRLGDRRRVRQPS